VSEIEELLAASYERVSTKVQGYYGYALGVQSDVCAEFAERHPGMSLLPELRFRDGEEENASGVDYDLPGLTKMLAAAHQGLFKVLIVPSVDRLARDIVKSRVIERTLEGYGVRVAYVREGETVDPSQPNGKLNKSLLLGFAEFERDTFRLRSIMGRYGKARLGHVVGSGRAPYGLRFVRQDRGDGRMRTVGLQIDRPLAGPQVREALLRLEHEGLFAICDDYNRRGIPFGESGMWDPAQLHRMALNPVYMGVYFYGEGRRRRGRPRPEGAVPVPVEPLLTTEEFERIEKALAKRAGGGRGRRRPDDVSDPFFLRGMLRCGDCGRTLKISVNNAVRYYACPSGTPADARRLGKPACHFPPILAEGVEAEAKKVVEYALLDDVWLELALDHASGLQTQADRERADRRAAIARLIAEQTCLLEGLLQEIIRRQTGEITRELIRGQMDDAEKMVAGLQAEDARIAAERTITLGPAEADEVRRLAATIREARAKVTEADWAKLFRILGVEIVCRAGTEGVQLLKTRGPRRWQFAWKGKIDLSAAATQLLLDIAPLTGRRME
jgi:site-specific DNA recombinase